MPAIQINNNMKQLTQVRQQAHELEAQISKYAKQCRPTNVQSIHISLAEAIRLLNKVLVDQEMTNLNEYRESLYPKLVQTKDRERSTATSITDYSEFNNLIFKTVFV